eukprot:scpid96428/ scgid33483/ 
MRSAKPYKLKLPCVVGEGEERPVKDIPFAECYPCPAGKAPHASCKHIAALLYALVEFCELGFTREFVTVTDTLQSWNKPHTKKSEPKQAVELDWSKPLLKTAGQAKRLKTKQTPADIAKLDPRAPQDRGSTRHGLHLPSPTRCLSGNTYLAC